MRKLGMLAGLAILLLTGTLGCSTTANDGDGGKIKVVATTSILADVVGVIGGEMIDLNVLLPPGSDAHTFQATPQDIAAVSAADIIFINGLGLEAFLDRLLDNAGGGKAVIAVSEGIETIALAGGEVDPHVWLDPNNVMVWVDNIAAALSEMDPSNTAAYQANAAAYQAELRDLDEWIEAEVTQIPAERRRLVSDHQVFGYFGARYGFELVGAIIPGYSTLAEPSARELAALQDAMRESGAAAIFVGETINANLAQRVAEDTGTQLVFVYTGSLSREDGPAGSYVEMMRFNVAAMVRVLR